MKPLDQKRYSHQEMIANGGGGHLSVGYKCYIPISKLDGLEPQPTNNESDDGHYYPGREIVNPIEVIYSAADDAYMVYAGNHRIAQAEANNQAYILAFVEPDQSRSISCIGSSATFLNPDYIKPSTKRKF